MTSVTLITIAILAKAPVPGFAKTRLIPALGTHGAAAFQDMLLTDTVERACAAGLGDVAVWAAPDPSHPAFAALARTGSVRLHAQPEGDLGARMLAAAEAASPVLIIGTDCPALSPALLRDAADALRHRADVVIIPAEDGGYVLIGLRRPQPALFRGIAWSTDHVMAQTRQRLTEADLRYEEFAPLWDVDEPDDLARLDHKWHEAGFAP